MARTRKDAPVRVRFKDEHDDDGNWWFWWAKGERPKKRKEVDYQWHWLQGTPSWWTRLFMNRPQRRKFRKLEREMQKINNYEELEDVIPPNHRHKPHHYYW